MRLTTLARRYAGALFEAARGQDVIDRVESDLGLVTYSLQTMPRLREVMAHPLIPPKGKKDIVAEIFRDEIEDITLRFLYLLINKRREEILEEVESEFVRFANDFRGILPALVISAVPLTLDEQSRLRAGLQESTGKRVELQLEEDPSLVGGLCVRIGDTVIDGSVKGYLASLRERLLGRE
jgi:F-type H+-transporting ATPase subunit delta